MMKIRVSIFLYQAPKKENVIVMVLISIEYTAWLEGTLVISHIPVIIYEQCKVAWGFLRDSVIIGTKIQGVEPRAPTLLLVTQKQLC